MEIKIVSLVFIRCHQLFVISVLLSFACWISVFGSAHFFPRPGALRPALPGDRSAGLGLAVKMVPAALSAAPPDCLQGVSGLNMSHWSPSLTIPLPVRASLPDFPGTDLPPLRANMEARNAGCPEPRSTRRRGRLWECPGTQRKREAAMAELNKALLGKGSSVGLAASERWKSGGEGRERQARPDIGRVLPQTRGEGRGRGAAARNAGRGSQVALLLLETQNCRKTVSREEGNDVGQESSKRPRGLTEGTGSVVPPDIKSVRIRC